VNTEPAPPPAARHPWFKFFPGDWQSDELLTMCSMAARGLLTELVCLMHKANPYGHLIVNGQAPTDRELAKLVRAAGVAELRRLRAELLDRGVLSVTPGGVLFSRRMVRKAKQSAIGHETGKRGGNPRLRQQSDKRSPVAVADPDPDSAFQNAHGRDRASVLDEPADVIAGAFLERYPEIYARCRNGAAYRVSRMKQERDLDYARELAIGWPELGRLEAMLEIFLRRSDLGEKNKPGTPGQFLHMAPDCDRLLRENGR
jgi:hypothetical protein